MAGKNIAMLYPQTDGGSADDGFDVTETPLEVQSILAFSDARLYPR
jgi:hypothetical protein